MWGFRAAGLLRDVVANLMASRVSASLLQPTMDNCSDRREPRCDTVVERERCGAAMHDAACLGLPCCAAAADAGARDALCIMTNVLALLHCAPNGKRWSRAALHHRFTVDKCQNACIQYT